MSAETPEGPRGTRAEPRPIWRRNLWVLAAGQLVAVSAMGVVMPFIPFFVRELGVTERAAVERWSGLIFSAPFLAAGIMSPVWGWVADRFGHRIMVIRAILGLAVLNTLMMFVETPAQFYALRLIQGVVTGFIPASLAITSASTPPEKLTGALARLQASASAGRLVGPAIGGLLAGILAFRYIFLAVGMTMGVVAALVILFLREPPRSESSRAAARGARMFSVLSDGRIRLGVFGLLFAMSAVSMAMPVFPLFVEDLLPPGYDAPFWTGIGFAVVAAFTLFGATQVGRVTARFGLKPVLIGSLLLTAIALAVHPLARGIPGLLGARALLGLGVAGVQPVLFSMIGRLAPEGRAGGVAGFASSTTILGFFVGPMSGGWLANHLGVGGVFELSAGATLVCAVAAAAIARREGLNRRVLAPPIRTPR